MAQPSFIPLLDLPPPAPNISLAPPKARFLPGDAVSIACAARRAARRADRIRASASPGTAGWASDVRTSRARGRPHRRASPGPGDGGFHTCSYSVRRRGGRLVHSPPSRAVLVDVRDLPAPPNLTVTPSALTVRGQPLLFLCAAPPGHAPRRRFRFFRGELEVSEGMAEGSGRARMRVESSGRNQTGNFSCSYEEEMAEGRWIAPTPARPCPWWWKVIFGVKP
ncbi:uncharacterized protein LOC115916979, partial [Camarhynchus parvulus]|uniref:uncharacterized protein LOC115916979 n=1 Tax=Geospiza parvula TaxID=87175 RepID=UPI0012382039